jgi:hypothetical protein
VHPLLDAVNSRPKLTQAFRLEIKFLQNSAEFRICLDTVAWYDCYLRVNSDLSKVVEIARKYVSTTRREISPDEDGPFVIDYQEIEKEKAYIRCRTTHDNKNSESKCSKYTIIQCLYNVQCPVAFALTFYHIILIILLIFSIEYDHPTLICKGNVITRDGHETTCDYYFPTKFTVQELTTKEYAMLLRRKPIRELLMLPCPIKEKDNLNHFDNETLVKNNDF